MLEGKENRLRRGAVLLGVARLVAGAASAESPAAMAASGHVERNKQQFGLTGSDIGDLVVNRLRP